MHPERDEKRRKATARALEKQYGEDHGVVYVDAAEYTSGSRMTLAVAESEAKLLTSSAIIAISATVAEEAGIALALMSTSATIISDCKSAILNFAYDFISRTASRFLRFWQSRRSISLMWTPAHAGPLRQRGGSFPSPGSHIPGRRNRDPFTG
ncbi:hypothetical protein HPB50_023107 [Hyalomma asiaticum]|uniref:Uncharacterized protein n=1 Tax=Hyalomma asiaticum TaxID=266040 RepID=A0ACB7TRZ2_HYAAI|nr:hypothetical protein HPB50_023107 [Hyalomma asiaticum]